VICGCESDAARANTWFPRGEPRRSMAGSCTSSGSTSREFRVPVATGPGPDRHRRRGGDPGAQYLGSRHRADDRVTRSTRRRSHAVIHGARLHKWVGNGRYAAHMAKPGLVTVAGQPGDELAPGTLNSILKQAGLKP
jgi:hypothetical protein